MLDPRRVLGVSPSATPNEIRRAFRRMVLEVHPDRAGARSEARLLEVVDAYEALTGKAKPRRARAQRAPHAAGPARRRSRGFAGRPYRDSEPTARDRFNCAGCHDTFTIEGECPRCGIPLTDGPPSAPPSSAEVDAYMGALEAQGDPPAWHGTLEQRLPIATIGTLLTSGALALTIHAPIAIMMIGYGLALLCADAVLGRA